MRSIRRPSALLLTAVLLFGLPYVLLWRLPWPEPDLSWTGLLIHLRNFQLPPGLATTFLIITLWALWGLYAIGTAAEIVARLRGRPRWFRPLGPLQIIAATAIGGSLAVPAQALADTVVVQDAPESQDTADSERTAAGQDWESGSPTTETGGETSSTERVRSISGFAVNSAEATDPMREDLAAVLDLIREHGDPDAPILVTGHTDQSGSAAVNQELSERRAQSIADHITAELGDSAPQIQTRGAGAGQQLADRDAPAQRRVEITYSVKHAPAVETPRPEAEPVPEVVQVAPLANSAEIEAGDHAQQTAGADELTGATVVMEIPAAGVLSGVAFAGVVGGFVAGRRGGRKLALALPRSTRALTTGTPKDSERRPLTAPPQPPRSKPGDDFDQRVIIELSHIPGIGITGPGAHPAARRLIANALSAESERIARVLITKPDVNLLLGAEGQALLDADRFAAVRVVDTMHNALTILQRELHDHADKPIPMNDREPLVLIATPTPEHEIALSGLLLHGQERGITAVMLGRWPLGGSCTIELDGLITETSSPLTGISHAWWPGCTAAQVNDLVREYNGAEEVERSEQGWKTALVLSVTEEPAHTEVADRGAAWGADRAADGSEASAGPLEAQVGASRRKADSATGTIGAAAAWEAFTSAFEEEEAREEKRERALRAVAAPKGPSPWKRRQAEPEPVAEPELTEKEPVTEVAEPVAEVAAEPVTEVELAAAVEPVTKELADQDGAEPAEPVGAAELTEPVTGAFSVLNSPAAIPVSKRGREDEPKSFPKPVPKRFRVPTPHFTDAPVQTRLPVREQVAKPVAKTPQQPQTESGRASGEPEPITAQPLTYRPRKAGKNRMRRPTPRRQD